MLGTPQSKDYADTVARLIQAGQDGDPTAQKKIGDMFTKSKEDPRIQRILKDAVNRIERGDVEPGNSTAMELGDSLGGLEGNDAGIDPKLGQAFQIIRELVAYIGEIQGGGEAPMGEGAPMGEEAPPMPAEEAPAMEQPVAP